MPADLLRALFGNVTVPPGQAGGDLSGDVWSSAQVERAVVAVLTCRFSDWRLTEIEIS
jgi:hypothetical protein